MKDKISLDYCGYCGGDLPNIYHKDKIHMVKWESIKRYFPELLRNKEKIKFIPICPNCFNGMNRIINGLSFEPKQVSQ